VRPAEPGRLAQAYQGRPVYDNYAVFEVPVTMTSEAKLGEKHTVALDLKFDLYDGNSAQPVGRFVDRVATEIEVGVVPDPLVKGAPARSSGEEERAATVSASGGDGEAVEPVATEPDGKVIGAAEPVPAPAPVDAGSGDEVSDPAPVGAGGPPTSGSDDGLPMPLLLGGGAILVVILLLLVRRKRRARRA
jgi:LPXTG-motif cell wall-anchored protein